MNLSIKILPLYNQIGWLFGVEIQSVLTEKDIENIYYLIDNSSVIYTQLKHSWAYGPITFKHVDMGTKNSHLLILLKTNEYHPTRFAVHASDPNFNQLLEVIRDGRSAPIVIPKNKTFTEKLDELVTQRKTQE